MCSEEILLNDIIANLDLQMWMRHQKNDDKWLQWKCTRLIFNKSVSFYFHQIFADELEKWYKEWIRKLNVANKWDSGKGNYAVRRVCVEKVGLNR